MIAENWYVLEKEPWGFGKVNFVAGQSLPAMLGISLNHLKLLCPHLQNKGTKKDDLSPRPLPAIKCSD